MKKISLDSTDQAILGALLLDARLSQRALGERIGLSAPAIRERIRRMENEGVIEGFSVEMNLRALGYGLEALVRLEPLPGKLRAVEIALRETPEVVQCDAVTGEDCFVARIVMRDVSDLDRLLDPFHDKARTNTSIVKNVAVSRRPPPFNRYDR
jgi:Lrp/AsnC family transcriptional regulator, leucine-responsive regulatory protein